MVAASFDNVFKTYRSGPFARAGIAAVSGVTLTIPSGSTFALLGPNRAGKTTLIKLLLGLTRLNSGSIQRLGSPLADRSTLGRVGYMHENHAFPRYLSAGEVLTFYGGLTGVSTMELPHRVEALLERVGLADRRYEPITRFSKGMIQRLGLAQALMNEPDLLVLDEPTEGLDLSGRQLMREVVRGLKKEGKTVLLVSHVLPEVEELCDRAAVVVQGRVMFTGSISELKSDQPLEDALRATYAQGAAA